jgi:hypothetical protein
MTLTIDSLGTETTRDASLLYSFIVVKKDCEGWERLGQ